MPYSFDDQYNVVTKKFSGHLSSSNDHLITEFAIDYFQYQFDEIEIHNCWKIIRNTNAVNNNNIPLSTDVDRLENISWRKWAKIKNNLPEVAPEEVNWYKDCDITWLYGPLAGSSSSLSQEVFHIDSQELQPPCRSNEDLVPSRTSSFSSMTSASTAESSDDDQESLVGNVEEITVDDHYIDSIGGLQEHHLVKPILKNKRASSLGFLEFETPSSTLLKKKSDGKTVSFDSIVQIRQFETENGL